MVVGVQRRKKAENRSAPGPLGLLGRPPSLQRKLNQESRIRRNNLKEEGISSISWTSFSLSSEYPVQFNRFFKPNLGTFQGTPKSWRMGRSGEGENKGILGDWHAFHLQPDFQLPGRSSSPFWPSQYGGHCVKPRDILPEQAEALLASIKGRLLLHMEAPLSPQD